MQEDAYRHECLGRVFRKSWPGTFVNMITILFLLSGRHGASKCLASFSSERTRKSIIPEAGREGPVCTQTYTEWASWWSATPALHGTWMKIDQNWYNIKNTTGPGHGIHFDKLLRQSNPPISLACVLRAEWGVLVHWWRHFCVTHLSSLLTRYRTSSWMLIQNLPSMSNLSNSQRIDTNIRCK